MSAPNLAVPLRTAIVGDSGITSLLGTWNSEPAVFTRRPVPENATYPMVVVSPDIGVADEDYLVEKMPVIDRDISIYGSNETPAQYRVVEVLAYALRELFHRNRLAITVAGWRVMDIRARGPSPAPAEDLNKIGRVLMLRIRLCEA